MIQHALLERANHQCELCGASHDLSAYTLEPIKNGIEHQVLICGTCKAQLNDHSQLDAHHMRCLNDSMWHPEIAVQILSYRLLHALKHEDWAQSLIDMMYFEDDVQAWADAGINGQEAEDIPATIDSNGTVLQAGDHVTLIKDLDVKGAGFTAKRGTLVKNIRLSDNPKHIEGKINGTSVVLVAAYVKKA